MRARSLKPSIFVNELLAAADPLCTVIFAGLWCAADREGRLEDRPVKLHIEINPARPIEGTHSALKWLCEQQFIRRYEVGEHKYIQVLAFSKHQSPHHNEKPSALPPPKVTRTSNQGKKRAQPRQQALSTKNSSLATLTPDSGLRTPDCSLLRERGKRAPPDFEPSAEDRETIARELPSIDIEAETAKFRDHEFERPRKDWYAAWRNWLRNAKTLAASRHTNGVSISDEAEAAWVSIIKSKDGPAERSPRLQAAIEAAGGWLTIQMRTSFDVAKIKRAFCAAYGEGE